jgi:hypothetical protein
VKTTCYETSTPSTHATAEPSCAENTRCPRVPDVTVELELI